MKLADFKAQFHNPPDNDWSLIAARLDRALARVMDHDRALLERGPSERAVAHRLAVYLEDEFPGWNTDCEYNRQGQDGSRKQVSSELPLLPPSKTGADAADVDPDIIVHRRGPDGPNLLVVEVKSLPSSGLDRDRAKLRKYLTDQHLRYTFAVLVTYRIESGAGFEPLERVSPA